MAVVVPATDAPVTLTRCLATIRGAAAPPDELIVVDQPQTLSAAEARNVGARRASSDLLVFVDGDVEVRFDTFLLLRAAFEREPELTAVFGSYDDVPAVPGLVSSFRNLLHHHVHRSSPGRATTFWSGLGAVRREAFERSGGFDAERFAEPSVEDIELGMRLVRAGAWIELMPEVQGTHLKSWSLSGMLRTDFLRRGVPWAHLQLDARRPSVALNLGWRHRLSATACVVGVGIPLIGHPLALTGPVAGLMALVALNLSFYGLLGRRLGGVGLAAGVLLHALHLLTAAAALSAAVLVRALDGSRRRRASLESEPATAAREL